MSLRGRLTALATVAVLVAIVAAFVIAWSLTRSTMMAEVDRQLADSAKTVPIAMPSDKALESATRPVEPGQTIQVSPAIPILAQRVDADGHVQRAPGQGQIPVGAPERELLSGRSEADDRLVRTATVDGEPARILSIRDATGGLVQFSRPLTDVYTSLSRLRWLFLGIALLCSAVAGLAGWLVSRAGLAPVRSLTLATERVAATRDLEHRIPAHGTDEVARLSRAVNEMLEALDSARAQQRRLVEDAGHELRSPLATLRTNLGMLLRAENRPDRHLDPAERRAVLEDLDAESEALSELVTEVLDLARGDTEHEPPSERDIGQLVEAAATRVRRSRPDVPIAVSGATEPAVVRHQTLERAVTNLIRNAVQVSRSGERVDVTIGGDADAITIVVGDRGPGIPDADTDRVFDRFYRGADSRAHPGSGLGLAIVAQAAAHHGGTVQHANRAAGGSTFTLRIPRAAAGELQATN